MGENKKQRLILLDILRIVCALLIYARHSITMYGCTYGHSLDALFTGLTTPVMTCFFLLSGFSIHYQHRTEELTAVWSRSFLKKRLISIMPSYLLVAVIWPVVYYEQVRDWILLLPVNLIGVQTSYRTLFGITHNGGTWFVSCMLLCYICYPIIKAVLGSKDWVSWAIVIISHFLLMYSNVIISAFSLDGLYSNPIARTAEFIVGAGFAEVVLAEKMESCAKKSWGWKPVLISSVLFSISTVISVFLGADVRMMIYGYYVIPATLLVLYISIVIPAGRLGRSKLLSILSGMSYQFFLAQLFLWNLTTWILNIIGLRGNTAKISVSFILCVLISFITWRFFDKPIRKMLSKKLL